MRGTALLLLALAWPSGLYGQVEKPLHESYLEPIRPKTALESVFVAKQDLEAGRGRCLPPMVGEDYREELERFRVERSWRRARGGRSELPQGNPGNLGPEPARSGMALARVFQMIERLSGGGFLRDGAPMSIPTTFFNSPDAVSRQLGPRRIELGCGSQARTGLGFRGRMSVCGTSNHALIAHEFAHKVGNHRGPFGDLYGFYRRHMREDNVACYPTGYSKRRYNEEVAEVFAAYVTNPDLLVPDPSVFDVGKARLLAGAWPVERSRTRRQKMGCVRAYLVMEMFFQGLSSFAEIASIEYQSCRDRREGYADGTARPTRGRSE